MCEQRLTLSWPCYSPPRRDSSPRLRPAASKQSLSPLSGPKETSAQAKSAERKPGQAKAAEQKPAETAPKPSPTRILSDEVIQVLKTQNQQSAAPKLQVSREALSIGEAINKAVQAFLEDGWRLPGESLARSEHRVVPAQFQKQTCAPPRRFEEKHTSCREAGSVSKAQYCQGTVGCGPQGGRNHAAWEERGSRGTGPTRRRCRRGCC